MRAEAGEVRPGHVDRAILRDSHRLVIGELAVRTARFARSLKCADQCECRIGATATGGPGPPAVAGAAEPERDLLSFITKAREVGGAAVGAERHIGIPA